jgi:hypothetical protein
MCIVSTYIIILGLRIVGFSIMVNLPGLFFGLGAGQILKSCF